MEYIAPFGMVILGYSMMCINKLIDHYLGNTRSSFTFTLSTFIGCILIIIGTVVSILSIFGAI